MGTKSQLAKPQLIIPINMFTVDCGKCGGRLYEVKILPQSGRGKIMAIRCIKCKNTLKVDNKGWIEGTGETKFESQQQQAEKAQKQLNSFLGAPKP